MKDLITKIWSNPILKEGFLFVVTAVALTLAMELSNLLDLLKDNETLFDTLDDLKVWAGTALNVIVLTAIRQAIAFAAARIAGTKL